jgi:hypothetical protein
VLARLDTEARLFRRNVTDEAGREARLAIVCLMIRVLFQVKFLSCPRTQNSPDLAAVNRALV